MKGISVQKLFALFAVVAIFLSFQNCSRKGDHAAILESTRQPADAQKLSVEGFREILFYDPQNGVQYELDISSGKIKVMNDNGIDQGTENCLSDAQKDELGQILAQAEICEPHQQANSDRVCAQSYQYPYAAFINGGTVIRLGEKKDSCSIPADLCGDKGQKLRTFSQELVKNPPACH